MTPYYPDRFWFHRLCSLCILCCDKEKYTKNKYYSEDKYLADDDQMEPTQTQMTVDTMSAVKTGAQWQSDP